MKERILNIVTLDKLNSFLNVNNSEMNPTDRHDNCKHVYRSSAIPVIFIGTSSCARAAGALRTLEAIKEYVAAKQKPSLVIEVGCIGLCSEEPIVDIQLPLRNRISFKHITQDKVRVLLDSVFEENIPTDDLLGQYNDDALKAWAGLPDISEFSFFAGQKRLVMDFCGIIDPGSIEEYISAGGYKAYLQSINRSTREEVCSQVTKSGLRGRAGGGFPVGLKWAACLQSQADLRYVICNAQESDPGAFLDRCLLESIPHQLIEGVAIASYASGASKAYIYVRNDYKKAIELLKSCLQQAKEYGITGQNIFASGFNIEIELRIGPGAFVCGEETALIGSIEGRRGMPRMKPPYPSESGLFHKPTVINNVESLCNIPFIICNGAEKFNTIGTEKSAGTKIFAVSGKSKYSGLIEVPMGTSLHNLIFDLAGGTIPGKAFKAIQLGGPNGWCIPGEKLDTLIDYEELISIGAGMGSGGVLILDESCCMVDMARYYMDFMQQQSCGKCIPCREGSKRSLEILEAICKRPVSKNGHSTLERFRGVMQLESISNVMKDTSVCGLGINASNPVLSALHWFREEFEEHIFDRFCRSGTCRELRTYQVEFEKCIGCGICAKVCPENAILGSEYHPYYIVEEKCNGCGQCQDSCMFAAININ